MSGRATNKCSSNFSLQFATLHDFNETLDFACIFDVKDMRAIINVSTTLIYLMFFGWMPIFRFGARIPTGCITM